ncbi:MAG: hypothetical protein ABJE95_27720 [Byssovorax sp.]
MTGVTAEFYPFLLQTIGATQRTERDLARMFDEICELNLEAERKGTRHVMISTNRNGLSATERKLIVKLSKEALAKPHKAMICCYAILPDALARGGLTALKWLLPALETTVGVATPEKAIELACGLLTRSGVPFNPVHARLAIRRLNLECATVDIPPSARSVRS